MNHLRLFSFLATLLVCSSLAIENVTAQSLSGITEMNKDQGFFHQSINFSRDNPELVMVNVDYDGKGNLSFHWIANNLTAGPLVSKTVLVERIKNRSGKVPNVPEIGSYGSGWLIPGDSVVRLPYSPLILKSGSGRNRFDGTFRASVVLESCPTSVTFCDYTVRKSLATSNSIEFVIKNNRLLPARQAKQ